jgi:hypothetical protein
MKLRNLTENPNAAVGATVMKKAVGGTASGQMVAKGLDKVGSGQALNPQLIQALAPYAELLNSILSDNKFRARFMGMVKQIHADKQKAAQQAQQGQQESVTEDQDSVDAVAGAITRRIMMQHMDLLSKYGPVKVMAAIDDVADFAGSDGLDEIGSSDVSIWTKQVIQDLEAGHFDHVDKMAEGMVDIEYGVDPKMQKLVDIGHLLRKTLDVGSGVKWDDADFNKAANLADALISIGATFGPKNLKDALKLADMDIAQAQELIAKASNKTNESDAVDAVDTVSMDVPLLLRMLEYAREDAQEDVDLHTVTDKMIELSKEGTLTMDHYDSIVGETGTDIVPVEESQWGKPEDILRQVLQTLERKVEWPLTDVMDPQEVKQLVSPLMQAVSQQLNSMEESAAVNENLGYGYNPIANTADQTNVNYSQTKQMGDATVTVSANAKSMDELQRVLKLAGLEVTPAKSYAEPTVEPTPTQPAEEVPCGCDEPAVEPSYDNDVKYSTDKQTLINVLRDKLQKSIG